MALSSLALINNDDCAIVYSKPSSSVQRTGDNNNPPIKSITSIVVKQEPKSLGLPHSPTCWPDYIESIKALKKHELMVKKQTINTPQYITGSFVKANLARAPSPYAT